MPVVIHSLQCYAVFCVTCPSRTWAIIAFHRQSLYVCVFVLINICVLIPHICTRIKYPSRNGTKEKENKLGEKKKKERKIEKEWEIVFSFCSRCLRHSPRPQPRLSVTLSLVQSRWRQRCRQVSLRLIDPLCDVRNLPDSPVILYFRKGEG